MAQEITHPAVVATDDVVSVAVVTAFSPDLLGIERIAIPDLSKRGPCLPALEAARLVPSPAATAEPDGTAFPVPPEHASACY